MVVGTLESDYQAGTVLYLCDVSNDYLPCFLSPSAVCVPNPCQNGGTCNACKNGGTCLEEGRRYDCDCIGGYTGTHCEDSPQGSGRSGLQRGRGADGGSRPGLGRALGPGRPGQPGPPGGGAPGGSPPGRGLALGRQELQPSRTGLLPGNHGRDSGETEEGSQGAPVGPPAGLRLGGAAEVPSAGGPRLLVVEAGGQEDNAEQQGEENVETEVEVGGEEADMTEEEKSDVTDNEEPGKEGEEGQGAEETTEEEEEEEEEEQEEKIKEEEEEVSSEERGIEAPSGISLPR